MSLIMTRPYAAAGNAGGIGIFTGGHDGAFSAYVDKYTFSDNSRVQGTSMNETVVVSGAHSTTEKGFMSGGRDGVSGKIGNTDTYVYGTDVVGTGTTLEFSRSGGTACNNATGAIIALGHLGIGSYTSTSEKYTYAGDVVAGGTALAVTRAGLAGCSSTTFGLLSGGAEPVEKASAVIEKYTFADVVSTVTATLGLGRRNIAAISNETLGIVGGGDIANVYSTYTDIIVFSTLARTLGNVLSYAGGSLAACSDKTSGVFGGGYNAGNLAFTSTYDFVPATSVAGASLGSARNALNATSNAHGGL